MSDVWFLLTLFGSVILFIAGVLLWAYAQNREWKEMQERYEEELRKYRRYDDP